MRALILVGAAVAAAAIVAAQAPSPQQPTFRAGTNLVQVDVIVKASNGDLVDDLTADDFQVFDDGVPVPIAAFKFVDLTHPDPSDRYPVRNADDEEREASRDDTRLVAIVLDDYHIERFGPNRVVPALVSFVEHLAPTDLLGVYYPLDSPKDVHLTYERQAPIAAIRKLEARFHEYQPKHPVEEEHLRFLRSIERLRTQVVLTGLVSLATHLGELKVGRKSIIVVSEGFTAAGYEGSSHALFEDLQDVYTAANRNNVSIYTLDPRGLTFEAPGVDTLRMLGAETGGRAMIGNDFHRALAQIARESTAYYLLGFVSQHPADGRFHAIGVRTTRRATVSARKGYWALSEAELAASQAPPLEIPAAVTVAFNRLAEALRPGDETDVGDPRSARDEPGSALLAPPTIGVLRGREVFEPAGRPVFTRAQRIAVRAAIRPGTPPSIAARLLDRHGKPLTALAVSVVDGVCEVPLSVGALGVGDYVVQLEARRGSETAEHYIALRVIR